MPAADNSLSIAIFAKAIACKLCACATILTKLSKYRICYHELDVLKSTASAASEVLTWDWHSQLSFTHSVGYIACCTSTPQAMPAADNSLCIAIFAKAIACKLCACATIVTKLSIYRICYHVLDVLKISSKRCERGSHLRLAQPIKLHTLCWLYCLLHEHTSSHACSR